MKGLSKSRYTAFCQCPKNLWMKVYKPEEAPVDEALQARFEQGNEVGDLAMGLFGPYVEVTTKKEDGSLDLVAMVEKTRQEIEKGTEVICEASFTYEGNYCAVDIPMNACTVAYNKKFECGRIRELAALYPDLAVHLMNIADHIIDLLDPFSKGFYYVPAMGGSFSIKSVLPALFPDAPELNYHNLDDRVQNGGDAMTIFPRIQQISTEEAAASREALLRYCELDTWAMVKVWEKLKNIKDKG